MAASTALLGVGIGVLVILMLIINVYLLVYWQHPDDKNESKLARLLIIFGFQISAMSVLMIPIGILNSKLVLCVFE